MCSVLLRHETMYYNLSSHLAVGQCDMLKLHGGIQSKKRDSGDLHTIKRLKRLLKSFCVMRALAGKQQKGRTWTTPFSQLAGKQVSAALLPGSGLRPRKKR